MKGKLAEYVVSNNPKGASELLTRRYGMKPTRSMRAMVNQMNYIIMTYRERALEDIAEIHPDRVFIAGSKPEIVKEIVERSEVKSNCSGESDCEGCSKLTEKKSGCAGCGGTCGGMSNASGCGCGGKLNADGATSSTPEDVKVPQENNVGKAIVYLSVGLAGAIVAGIIFKSY
jgi:hypothetical protein